MKSILYFEPNQSKMRTLLLAYLCIPCLAFAQADYNPFSSIGKKGKVLTLSNGRYKEFYGGDTVKRIGRVMFDVRSNKVVKILSEVDDSTYEFRREGDLSTRWLSIDPLATKFPYLSPYVFVENNPIILIDRDGREPIKSQVGTIRALIQVLKANNIRNIAEAADFFGNNHGGSKANSASSDNLSGSSNNTASNESRYLYTKKAGWLDMRHFFAGAEETESGTSLGTLLIKGEGVEKLQEKMGQPSAWSYEDLQSNLQGGSFGQDFKDLQGDDFYKALETKFSGLKVSTIDDAPNKADIPEKSRPLGQVPTNRTYTPLYAPEYSPIRLVQPNNTSSSLAPSDNTRINSNISTDQK